MIYVVASLFDEAAGLYGRPIFAPSIGAAVRSVSDEVNRPAGDNALYNHSSDFAIFQLGTFDDVTGRFELLDKPNRVALCHDLRVRDDHVPK